MTRKVSMWIVVALVGALAATTAAVVVLATHDRVESRAARGLPPADDWSHGWPDAQGDRRLPVMGELRGDWDGGRESPILPWVLFAVSTGTAVGLLVAWSPWRTAHAGAVSGPSGGDESPAQTAATPVTDRLAGQIDAQTTEVLAEAQTREEAGQAPPER
jgi:hypothetical protein